MMNLDMRKLLPIIMNPQASEEASNRLAQQGMPPPDIMEIERMLTPPAGSEDGLAG